MSMHATPNRRPRAVDRRGGNCSTPFPMLLQGGTLVSRERRRGDRRRLGFISSLDLFRGVPYSAVEEVLAACPVRRFESDEVLLEPGQTNTEVFLVVEGRLRVHLDAMGSGNAIIIGVGGCIGEMSIIDEKPVSAFVVAERGSRILSIRQEQFWSGILVDVGVVRNLLRLLTERMRRNNEAVLEGLRERLVLEVIQKELRLAHEIQAGMLSTAFALPGFAQRVDLHASMQAAREVGGDFYDFFVMPGGEICVLVGDVSDKGMAAALFMARTLEILRVVARLSVQAAGEHPDPAAIVTEVNRALCQNNPNSMFVTLFLALLDPATGDLRYCNAGHNLPYVRTARGKVREVDGVRCAPLGIKPIFIYSSGLTALGEGDTLFAFTDGVTEASDLADAMFGEARLEQTLREVEACGAAALTACVGDEVKRFSGTAPRSDDITLLALRLLPRV